MDFVVSKVLDSWFLRLVVSVVFKGLDSVFDRSWIWIWFSKDWINNGFFWMVFGVSKDGLDWFS